MATITSTTFSYTGAEQQWVVPPGVTSVWADVQGAHGGGNLADAGLGGRVQAAIPVTPGETLYISVGGMGQSSQGTGRVARGGFNGGGDSGGPTGRGGGGGASDIRRGGAALVNRAVVAGGGGGEGGGPYTPRPPVAQAEAWPAPPGDGGDMGEVTASSPWLPGRVARW